ncbi:hypothetical protein K1719_017714 [Acacia pycnantha]|nr:hypothetical protein K1719_017714 [Acacia pycnantha]
MESCLLDLAKNEVQSLVNLVKNEAQYLCCFNSYVENFEKKKNELAAKHKDVKRKFQKGKGVFSFKYEAQQWESDANDIIRIDTKIKKKLFLVGVRIAGRNIEEEKSFIHFESRESKFQDLLKKLQDENCNMIGLQGLGGTGKTSMAKEVGHKLKESKSIDKFIFLVVSQPPDFKKIRGELARDLDLNLDEVKEEELSSTILSRITNMDQKLLIILDDVWEEFDLAEKLGIPFGHECKGCTLLITTPLARALKNKPISVWKDALKTLEDGGLDLNLEVAYKCLKLSYDNLKSQKAKELLLISSLFPEDFEIPIKTLVKIGIGLVSFKENDKYHSIRSDVHGAITELIHSSLLLIDEEESVKMHDLVREVALWIGKNDIQSLLDLEKPIKGNWKYIYWKSDKFPDEIDGNKLEYLSVLLDDLEGFNVTDTFFKEMTSIKVLSLDNDDVRGPTLSLMNSLQPLKSVQTLILRSMDLGDISVLGNLLTLMTLWFYDCSIIELPKEILKLKKLSSLEIDKCEIERNNPFEVIEMCSQLEELTFVCNEFDDEAKDAISHNESPLTLHRYNISSEYGFSDFSEKYGLSRCFEASYVSNLVSTATFKQLVERAEVLVLGREDGQRMWKNLIPNFFPIDKQVVMDDLIVLGLTSHPNMEYLIDTKDHDPSMSAFCNLVELHLIEMGIEYLCRGPPPPSGFLEQLEILSFAECHKLKSILFNANYNLCHLKSMKLKDCPKLMSVFQPSTARSLIQLKKLTIENCSVLEYIIAGEDGDSNQKNYYESLFPSLEKLKLSGVPSFIGIVKEYHLLMSSSMQKQSPPLSRHNSRNLNQSLTTCAFSWVQVCCSLNKLGSANKETNSTIFEDRSLDQTNPLKFDASIDRGAHSVPAQSLLLQSLKNVREIKLLECYSIISLSTLSIATSTIALERLTIEKCHKIKCITTHEGDAQVDRNYCAIFPTLEKLEIFNCKELEFLFVSAISVGLQKLKSLTIKEVPELKCVFGNYQKEEHSSNHNQSDALHFDLPALETFYINVAPKINNIFVKNYSMVNWVATEINSIFAKNYSMVNWIATKKFDASIDRGAHSLPAQSLLLQSLKNVREIRLLECHNIISLSTLSIATSTIALERLTIEKCHKLKCITTHEGDSQVDRNYCAIFPTLEKLEIFNCKELEFLFVSAISVGLQKLKSLTIKEVPELKCVFGNYQKEEHSSNHNHNDELHFDLPLWRPSSMDRGAHSVHSKPFAAIIEECEGNKTFECHNIISLSTLSIATSTIALETLTIRRCHKLKCITTHEGDAQVDRNYCAIFPTLEKLDISDCEELEFLFVSAISVGLQKLKSLYIEEVPKLKCVFGNYQKEEHSSNENQNDELHVDLPALESIYIDDAPKMNGIFAKNYSMVNWIATEKFDASIDRGAHSLPTQSLLLQSLKNVREIRLLECHNIISLSTLSIATSTIALETLTIRRCHKLKCITTHEGDAQVDRNYCAIFPTLEKLEIINCKEFEFLFVSAISVGLQKLKSLYIEEVPKLKCVFGNFQKVQHSSNQNQNDELHVDLPALETLYIDDAPKMNGIFAKNYSMVNWIATEEVHASTIEAPLFHIYKAPMLKYVFGRSQHDDSLNSENQNIQTLIDFPALKYLSIEDVPKLVSIYPENYYMRGLYLRSVILRELPEFKMKPFNEFLVCWHTEQQETKVIEMCQKTLESLRYLFSITISDILPQLFSLNIANASELEHVLIKRDEMEEIVMKDVLPQRCHLFLRNLPNLISVCHGINFQKEDYSTYVYHCPKFDTSTTQHEADIETGNSQVEEKAEERLSSHMGEEITQQSFTKVVEARAEGVSTSLNQAPSSILSKSSDGVDHGDIKEAGMVQNENNLNVEPISLTRREQESSYSKGQIKTKDQLTDSQPMSAMPTTHFDIISQDEHSEIVEVKGEEGALILETPHPSSLTSKEEPIPVSLNSTSLSRSPSTTGRIFEEEEKGGLITTPKHESDTKAVSSLPPVKEHKTSNQGDPFVPPMTFISSEQQASDTILPLSFVPSNALTSPKQISMSTSSQSTYSGQLAECGSLEMASSICDTKDASSVAGVKEIVNMMKLEGFDKDWLESIKIKVFNCDASEFHHKQQVLKNLGNKLEANKENLQMFVIKKQKLHNP